MLWPFTKLILISSASVWYLCYVGPWFSMTNNRSHVFHVIFQPESNSKQSLFQFMSIIKCLNKPISTVLQYFFGSHEQKRKVITLSTSFLHIVQYLFLWQSKIYIHAISSISWPNQKHNSSNEAQMDTKSQMLWTSLSYAWSISQFSRGLFVWYKILELRCFRLNVGYRKCLFNPIQENGLWNISFLVIYMCCIQVCVIGNMPDCKEIMLISKYFNCTPNHTI